MSAPASSSSKVAGKRKRGNNNKNKLSVAEQTAKAEAGKIKKGMNSRLDSAYLQVYRLLSERIQRGNESFSAGVELILSYVGCSAEDDYVITLGDRYGNPLCLYASRARKLSGRQARLVLMDRTTVEVDYLSAAGFLELFNPANCVRFTVMDGLFLRPSEDQCPAERICKIGENSDPKWMTAFAIMYGYKLVHFKSCNSATTVGELNQTGAVDDNISFVFYEGLSIF